MTLRKFVIDYRFPKEVYFSESDWKGDFERFCAKIAEFKAANESDKQEIENGIQE